MQSERLTELLATVVCIAAGAFVAGLLAPSGEYFWPNALFVWVPQLAALLLFCLYQQPRPAFFAGVSLALATHLALFSWWLFSRKHPESMAWLGYLASVPGGVVGGYMSLEWLARRPTTTAVFVGGVATLGALVGIAANQLLVCSTLMYCRGS